MRFIVDAQLPPALARLLREHQHVADHLMDVDLLEAAATSIWDYALEHDAVIITKDEDFPHRQGQSTKASPIIVWLRIGNTGRRALGSGNIFIHLCRNLLPDPEIRHNFPAGSVQGITAGQPSRPGSKL